MDFFFFNDTATTEIYTLSLHDALPICSLTAATFELAIPLTKLGSERDAACVNVCVKVKVTIEKELGSRRTSERNRRSEEHTSELQSQSNLVCRLLLEKKKLKHIQHHHV